MCPYAFGDSITLSGAGSDQPFLLDGTTKVGATAAAAVHTVAHHARGESTDKSDYLDDVVRTKYVPLSDDSDDDSEEAEYERHLMLKYGLLRH
jgi:hypothetical protein